MSCTPSYHNRVGRNICTYANICSDRYRYRTSEKNTVNRPTVKPNDYVVSNNSTERQKAFCGVSKCCWPSCDSTGADIDISTKKGNASKTCIYLKLEGFNPFYRIAVIENINKEFLNDNPEIKVSKIFQSHGCLCVTHSNKVKNYVRLSLDRMKPDSIIGAWRLISLLVNGIRSEIEGEISDSERKKLKLKLVYFNLQEKVLNLIICSKMNGIRLGQLMHLENGLRNRHGLPEVDEVSLRRNLRFVLNWLRTIDGIIFEPGKQIKIGGRFYRGFQDSVVGFYIGSSQYQSLAEDNSSILEEVYFDDDFNNGDELGVGPRRPQRMSSTNNTFDSK